MTKELASVGCPYLGKSEVPFSADSYVVGLALSRDDPHHIRLSCPTNSSV